MPSTGARSASELPPGGAWTGANVTLAGRVVDARSGEPLANATVGATLLSTASTGRACGGPVPLPWASWSLPVHANGTFGPLVVPRPDAPAAAIALSARAPGFVDLGEERPARDGNLSNVTLALEPAASLTLRAPAGALVAWARNGTFALAGWTVVPQGNESRRVVAAAEYQVVVTGPAASPVVGVVDLVPHGVGEFVAPALAPAPRAPAVLGVASDPPGAPVAAWDAAGRLVGVAVADENGNFTMPLAAAGNVTLRRAPWDASVAVEAGASAPARATVPADACPLA